MPIYKSYSESDVREFIGWVCADVPELHTVEVPKLGESWERFKRMKEQPPRDSRGGE